MTDEIKLNDAAALCVFYRFVQSMCSFAIHLRLF